MRFASIAGRAHLQLAGGEFVDIEKATVGGFPADPQLCLEAWSQLQSWAAEGQWDSNLEQDHPRDMLDAPVPRPHQIFAVGLNYAQHAAETGLVGMNESPLIFTKFPSSVTGPFGVLELPSDTVDWEVELVVVIGKPAHRIPEARAWDHIAGFTLGQDFSERTLQMAGQPPQFSLAKSYPGFAPIGPVIVTLDEVATRDDIRIECIVNGNVVQSGSTAQLIHSVPRLVAHLASVCQLLPGDLIFTGTPDGVGMGRKPPVYLRHGDRVLSRCPEIGELEQVCRTVAGPTV